MTYLQTLFGFFNAPLFATFILGMFWKRMTPTAGWMGLVAGTASAVLVAYLSEDGFGSISTGTIAVSGQGAAFIAASTAFVVDIVLSIAVSLATKTEAGLRARGAGLLGDTQGAAHRPRRGVVPLVPPDRAPRERGPGHGHRAEPGVLRRPT